MLLASVGAAVPAAALVALPNGDAAPPSRQSRQSRCQTAP